MKKCKIQWIIIHGCNIMVRDVGAAPQKCKEVKVCCAATARAVKSHLPEQAAGPLRRDDGKRTGTGGYILCQSRKI